MARIFEFLRKLSWGLAPALLVACGGAAGVPSGSPMLATAQRAPVSRAGGWLYAIGFQGDVESYALPMVSGEGPAAKSGTKAESVAVDGAYLFATVNNLAGVAQFSLPLVNGEKPAVTLQVSSGGAIAAGKGFLYVGSSGSPGSVLAYTTPLKRGEPPSATISAGVHLPAALAADGTHLYVVNQSGTVTSYRLPLQNGERPSGTITNLFETSGIAVDGRNLYLSRYDTAQVFVYRLPLTTGEKAYVTLNTGFNWAGPLAATTTDLYVSDAARYAWDFAVPIHAGEKTAKHVTVYPSNGNILAVQP